MGTVPAGAQLIPTQRVLAALAPVSPTPPSMKDLAGNSSHVYRMLEGTTCPLTLLSTILFIVVPAWMAVENQGPSCRITGRWAGAPVSGHGWPFFQLLGHALSPRRSLLAALKSKPNTLGAAPFSWARLCIACPRVVAKKLLAFTHMSLKYSQL